MRKPMGRRFTPVPMHCAQHQRPLARQAGHLRQRQGQQGGPAGAGAELLAAAAVAKCVPACLSAPQRAGKQAAGLPWHHSPLRPHTLWQHCGALVI